MDAIRDCHFSLGDGSCSLPAVHVTDGAYLCGHCEATVFLRPGDLAENDLSCEGGIMTWFSRPLQTVTHRCGQDAVGDAIEQLIDLTRTVGV